MKPSEYDKLDRIEDRMWWFTAMHANLLAAAQRSAIDRLHLPILDAGCGTGGFLSRLAVKYCSSAVIGLDLDLRACTRAAVKSARPVCAGSINDLPFANNALAVIFSADVLCHEGVDEHRALRQFHRCLCQNGWLILNLPAYRWMLSRHDSAVSNVRRYTATGLRRVLKVVGFRPVYISYWNALLLPLMPSPPTDSRFASRLNRSFATQSGVERKRPWAIRTTRTTQSGNRTRHYIIVKIMLCLKPAG